MGRGHDQSIDSQAGCAGELLIDALGGAEIASSAGAAEMKKV